MAGTAIPTAVIASRFHARESLSDLAKEYGRTNKDIEEAIRWESRAPLENFVLFLDERLLNCRPIHSALNELNVENKRHGQCFKPGVEDTEWLPEIGKLTSDKRIRYNQLERDKIVHYRIREFVFTSGNLSGAMMGEGRHA
jgi:PIN domain-containing protein